MSGPVSQGLEDGSKSHWMASKFANAEDPSIILAIKAELDSEETKVKNTALKTLSHLAALRPEWFRDDLDFFLRGIDSKKSVERWAAMDAAGNLIGVDAEGKIDESILGKLVAALEDESMVTAAHAVDNLARIAAKRTDWQSQILAELFRVETIPRDANCREVLLSKVATAMGPLIPALSEVNRSAVVRFLNRLALSDGRDGQKAAKVLKRL